MLFQKITRFDKCCNIILNFGILLFGTLAISLLVMYIFFSESTYFQSYVNHLVIVAIIILLFLLLLSTIKENSKKMVNINFDKEPVILEVNVKNKEQINKISDIHFLGNFIITGTQRFEVDDRIAFIILSHQLTNKIKYVKRNMSLWSTNPENFFEKIINILSFGLSLN